MSNLARNTLCDLVKQYGSPLGNDPKRCEGLLKDLCGDESREIFFLVSAAKEGIPERLITSQSNMPRELLITNLVERLQNSIGIEEKYALWAVESWALALGVEFPEMTAKPSETLFNKTSKAVPPAEDVRADLPNSPNFNWKLMFGTVATLSIFAYGGIFLFAQNSSVPTERSFTPDPIPSPKPTPTVSVSPSISSQFFCGKDGDGTPITAFSHPSRGDVIIIRWESNYFKEKGFDPQSRCQEVSLKFQQYRDQSKLQYITTGRKNGYNIICVAEGDRLPCLNDKDQGQLWTLKPESNPNEVLAALKDRRAGGDQPLDMMSPPESNPNEVLPALKESQPIPESNPNEVLPALKDRRAGGDKVLVESQQIWVKVNDLAENNPTKSVF
jgi:hypothetical protein